jgi:hypothetical protein
MSNGNRVIYDKEGVEVNLPAQSRAMKVVRLPTGTLKDMPAKAGGFQPGRLVINVAAEIEGSPGSYAGDFNPPLELKVRYTPADYEYANREGKPLRLAFWDGDEWVPFTSEKHQFKLYPNAVPSSGGYATVAIRKWGDPPSAWGK